MEKQVVNKMECRFPTLFKIMWCSTIVWGLVSIANYFGHWLLPNRLDQLGTSIIVMFGITLLICYGKAFSSLLRGQGRLFYDSITRKVISYSLLVSYIIFLMLSIWELYWANDYEVIRESWVNGGSLVSMDGFFVIIGNVIKAFFVALVAVLVYWYVRLFFCQFSGRIRRMGVEIILALMMLAYLSVYKNDFVWINAIVVLIASSFLYDIWKFADFQKEEFHVNWIKKLVEDNNN